MAETGEAMIGKVSVRGSENSPIALDEAKSDASDDRSLMARSQEAYEGFARAVDGPMMVITILWLPVSIIPLLTPVHGTVATTFEVIDYTIWASLRRRVPGEVGAGTESEAVRPDRAFWTWSSSQCRSSDRLG